MGLRSQRDEAILVMKSADDRFCQDVVPASNPVTGIRRCDAIGRWLGKTWPQTRVRGRATRLELRLIVRANV
jgi:hypothetical protein